MIDMKIRIRLSIRVLCLVLGTVFAVILFASGFATRQFRNSIVETMEKKDAAVISDVSTIISNLSSNQFQSLLTLRSIIESVDDQAFSGNNEFYNKTIKKACEDNQALSFVWLSFDSQYLDASSEEGRTTLKAENTSYGAEVSSKTIAQVYDDMEDPYFICKDAGAPIIAEPDYYLYDGSTAKRTMRIPMAMPINKNGSFAGVIGIDINANSLQAIIDSIGKEKNQHVFILSPKGHIMAANPDKNFNGQLYNEIDTLIGGFLYESSEDVVNRTLINRSTGDTYCNIQAISPENLNSQWKVVVVTDDNIDEQMAESLNVVTRAILIGLLLLALIIAILTQGIVNPIKKVNEVINRLAQGKVDETLEMRVESNNELGQMTDSSNKVVEGLLQVTKFAENIGNGNSDYKFSPLSDRDVLGNAIIEMKSSLDEAKEEENQRHAEEEQLNWASSGINLFNKVLRIDNKDMQTISAEIIKTLTLYLNAQMGALYIVPEDREGLELVSHLGFGKDKGEKTFFSPSDGLMGRIYHERETIFISEIPDDMERIGSGLGRSLPKSALIVPLIYNSKLVGAIELYSLKVFEQYQIAFVEKLSENIASTLSTVKINAQTTLLLSKAKQQAEVLEQQEEEIRQNMEEMQATQEETTHKEEGLLAVIESLSNIVPIVHYDLQQRVTDANEEFLNFVQTRRNKVVGKRHKADVQMTEVEAKAHEHFWDEILAGNIMEEDEQFGEGKDAVWLRMHFIPIYDDTKKIVDIVAVGFDITTQKKYEAQIDMVAEGVIPEELKSMLKTSANKKRRLIDLTNMNAAYKNDEKKIDNMLRRYYEQIPAQFADIEKTIESNNYKVLKMEVKALRTKINYLGVKPITDMLDTIINSITKNSGTERIPQVFADAKSKWEEAYNELTELIGLIDE